MGEPAESELTRKMLQAWVTDLQKALKEVKEPQQPPPSDLANAAYLTLLAALRRKPGPRTIQLMGSCESSGSRNGHDT